LWIPLSRAWLPAGESNCAGPAGELLAAPDPLATAIATTAATANNPTNRATLT
jgi:hypothetical protein